MNFRLILCFWFFVLDLALVRRMGEREKDIEIRLLRACHQHGQGFPGLQEFKASPESAASSLTRS